MTNKEVSDIKFRKVKNINGFIDEGDSPDSRLAALLAVHLVSQVLDEAYVIADAATESGQPWQYLEMLKNLKGEKLGNIEEGSYCVSTEDSIENVNSKINEGNTTVVATSTPQKLSDETGKSMSNAKFIGQGDEEFISDMRQSELSSPTSMFINHLFDMSDVERVIFCDNTEVPVDNQEQNDLLAEAMTKIMESYVNTALGIAFGQDIVTDHNVPSPERSPSTDYSGYSFLADAFSAEGGSIIGDIAFCLDQEVIDGNHNVVESSVIITEVTEDVNEEEVKREHNKSDVARYENAFLTLNRDYDQCSEEDGEPILQDPKGMLMQEIELEVTPAPDENLTTNELEQPKTEDLKATSAVSASSRKSSLMQRCRTQGARLLTCLRGWWRRKTPGKRKEARVPGSVRGLCPLSPDARRRASSLLDQSRLRSTPDPDRHVVWKFNTVSEALVNSSRWKNYTFDANPNECAEYVI